MIRCWVTHQQTWSKNCEFVTTSGSNTNNLEKIWMFGPWLPLMTAISQRLEAVLKHQNAFKTFIAHIPWFIQPHLQIWFCLVIGLSKTTKTTITVHECTFGILELEPSFLLNFDLKNLGYIFNFFPQRDNNTTCRFQLPPDVEGFLKPTIILFPTFDLEIFHASFTLFKPTKLRNFCSNGFNLWRGLRMPKKAKESGKFWRGFTEGPLGCSCFLLLVPCLVGVLGVFVERTKKSRVLLVLSNLLGWRCETNFD